MLPPQGHPESLRQNKELKSRHTILEVTLPPAQMSVTFHSYIQIRNLNTTMRTCKHSLLNVHGKNGQHLTPLMGKLIQEM